MSDPSHWVQSSPYTRQSESKASIIDFRNLTYVGDFDSHLKCCICHVPFIDPVVLACDHTFCASCFSEYRREGNQSERPRCPTCRSVIFSTPTKASRLVHNMCQDIRVQCPNEGCAAIMARGLIQHHATKLCPDEKLPCPDPSCVKKTKRRHFVPDQCVHSSRVECECGAVIELGRGEWLKHRDQDCSTTCRRCEGCGEGLSSDATDEHECQQQTQECPGAEYGCTDITSSGSLDDHTSSCTFARLAPYFKTQSRLLQKLQEELASSKVRNSTLETELDRLHGFIDQIQPRLDTHYREHSDNDIEEIPRESIPSAAAIHHRDLLLPAHIRDLTPSPEISSFDHDSETNQVSSSANHQMYNHLLYLHEVQRNSYSSLEADVESLRNAMAEMDARTSMQLMNETLRIKEDLAYTNAAVVSNRTQVQWLLNRERIGREQAILRERGRMMMGQQGPPNPASASDTDAASPQQAESYPFPSPMTRTLSGSVGSSASTSPMSTGIPVASRRPSVRGGSQERVKL